MRKKNGIRPLSKRAVQLRQAVDSGKIKPCDLRLAAYVGDRGAVEALGADLPPTSDDPMRWMSGLQSWGHLAFIHTVYAATHLVFENEVRLERLSPPLLHSLGNAAQAIGMATSVFERPAPVRAMLHNESRLIKDFSGIPSGEAQQVFTLFLCALQTVADAALAHEHAFNAVHGARSVLLPGAGPPYQVSLCPVMCEIRKNLLRWAIGSVKFTP